MTDLMQQSAGLNARVASADDGDVTASGVITHDEIPPDSF